MVIVLGIIALILGGAIALMGNIGEGAKLQRVDQDFSSIESALKMYALNNGGVFPTSQQGIEALVTRPTNPEPKRWTQYLKAVPKDPWNAEYEYLYPGSKDPGSPELLCKGRDGQQGTEDDMSNQEE